MGLNYLDCMSTGGIISIRENLIKAQAGGQKVFRFESGDPSFNPHPEVKKAITKALEEDKTHYIAVDGIAELKKAIATRSCKYGTMITPDDVFIVNGAMNGLFNTYMALQEDHFGSIAVPDPMWTEAVENIRLAGIDAEPISFDPATENYTWDKIVEEASGNLSGVFVNSPHNPTGKILTVGERMEIIQGAIDADLWIISDEAYETVVYEGEHTNLSALIPKSYDKWVSIHSMSKAYAMPGLRIGWIITKNQNLKSRLSKLLRCNINGVNSITQWGAVSALALDKDDAYFRGMNAEYKHRKGIMYTALVGNPILDPVLPEGGFFMWCRVNEGFSAEKVSAELASMGMGNAPGSCFGSSETTVQSIRFSFSVDTKQVEEGSKELSRILNDPEFQAKVRS